MSARRQQYTTGQLVDAQTYIENERRLWDEHRFMAEVIKLGQGTRKEPRFANPWDPAYHSHFSKRSEAGFPDICWTRNGVLLFAELKTQTGRMMPEQKLWASRLEAVSFRVENAIQREKGLRPMEERLVQYWLWRPLDWDLIRRVLS